MVLYGHWIEPKIWSDPLLKDIYRWIYYVHMPLFAFLSGLFVQHSQGCARQLSKTFSVYLFLQTAAVFLGNGAVRPFTPYWHLWYLLSCSFWLAIAWFWLRVQKRKLGILILILGFCLGCLAGCWPEVGRQFSTSRSIVFFPYFWLGVLIPPNLPWHKLRIPGLFALVLGILCCRRWGSAISTVFLYHAAPYSTAGGFTQRLICYSIGLLLGFFLLCWIPRRRFPFTRAGADTLWAYVLHAPLVLYLREQPIPLWAYPPIIIAFIYFIYKIRQWNSAMFGITVPKRRERRWLHSKKYTKNTQSRGTDSCAP